LITEIKVQNLEVLKLGQKPIGKLQYTTLENANPSDYDALLPGGVINPDALRTN
jgi:hypothetical protein